MAVRTFDVYTYGGGDLLWEVFNAAAAYMGGGDYLTLIRLFGVLALFWVVVELGVRKTLNWHWFAMFALLYLVFFVPKTNVRIHDRLHPASNRVVANVPFGMAAPAWLFSFLGTEITQALEALFSVPGDLRYDKHGMVFGSRMLAELREARFEDPLLRRNLFEYMRQCVFWNVAYGFYSYRDLYYSQDLLNLVFSTTRNSGIRGMFYDTGNGRAFKTCAQAAAALRPAIQKEVRDRLIPEWAARLFGHETNDPLAQKAMLLSALPAGFAFFTGAAQGA
ncbi:MAG: conjugal transfer protein TraG, partial [Zetaproteobacteria bacterium]